MLYSGGNSTNRKAVTCVLVQAGASEKYFGLDPYLLSIWDLITNFQASGHHISRRVLQDEEDDEKDPLCNMCACQRWQWDSASVQSARHIATHKVGLSMILTWLSVFFESNAPSFWIQFWTWFPY